MKLQVIGRTGCDACVRMKNEINDRIDEMQAINVEFEYINLNDLDDKDTFIQKHSLSAAPTTLIVESEQEIKRMTGYVPFDALIETLEGVK